MDTYIHALNVKKSTDRFRVNGVTNEPRNLHVGKIPGKIVGIRRVEERNSTLFFHEDGASVISLFHHITGEVTEIVRDSEFGCDWKFDSCFWIGYNHNAEKTLAPCNDLMIYWSSDKYYHVINVDELLDENRRESIKKLNDPCAHFNLFNCTSGTRIKIKTNKSGGRDLPPGHYYAVARLLDEADNATNWTAIEGPVYIGSKYNKPTDVSRQSIEIQVKSISDKYSRIEIAIIAPIGSAEQDVAHVIYDGSYNTDGVTAHYYSVNQHKKTIPLGQIFAKDRKWLRGEGMLSEGGKLHLYRTVQEFNPLVQKWAFQTRAYFVVYAVPLAQAHKYCSFQRDEVYGLGQVHQFCDYTVTGVGHIVGPAPGENQLNCTDCPLPQGNTGNNAKRLQVYNTLDGSSEDVCLTGGQKTTIREGHNPTGECADQSLTTRSTSDNECIEHEKYQQDVDGHIQNIQNTPDTVADCIDCNEAANLNDLKETEGYGIKTIEHFTDLFKTEDEILAEGCTDGSTSLKDAAKKLYNEAVKEAPLDEEITYRTVVKKTGGSNIKITGTGGNTAKSAFVFGTTNGEECAPEDEPIILERWQAGGYQSTYTYPETLDCEGQPLWGEYAGRPLQFHRAPHAGMVPLYYSAQSGVENRFDPANIPGKDTYVLMLGLEVENVYIPSFENGEIPKPLNEDTPFRIVIAKKEKHNQSVVANGYLTHTYKGKIGNKEYAVPRNAVNAYPNVDRSIDDDGSHLGEDWNEPIYTFHSPDTEIASDFSGADYLVLRAFIAGEGWVYGHYAQGKDVKEDEQRKDRRGMRSALNFTKWIRNDDFATCISGIEFVDFNSNLQNPEGIDYPILNKYRESCVALQTAERLPTLPINIGSKQYSRDNKDHSINVGGLDHEYSTLGITWYVTLKRINTQQYGAIEALQYVDIGLVGKKGETSVRGLVGDSFVQKWSDKRTAFISDKVGNYLNEDYPITATTEFLGSPEAKKRSVCDPPNRRGWRMKEFLGFWYPWELPENGDKKNPKNMANGHPTRSADDITASWWEAEYDLFYPRTSTHLNHLVVESGINLHYRSTGPPATREVFYEEPQGLDLDSSINKLDPEDCWLNDWHNLQLQASIKQREKKARLRFLLAVVLPAVLTAGVISTTALELGLTAMVSPIFGVGYLVLLFNIFTNKKLDQLLGLPICKMDDEGAQSENNTRGLMDNWFDYNYGFSSINDLNTYYGIPAVYNTCKCDALSNIIYSSNTQMQTSPVDAWKNFQALSYTGVSATSGLIQRLFIWDNGLYAQTTDGLLLLRQKNNSIPSAGGELLFGTSVFMENPKQIQDGAQEGFFGTEDPNASISCRHGDISIDYEGRDIIMFNGKIQSLVGPASGKYHYWQDNIPFCNETSCRDALQSGGTHYTFGYDPEYECILITKHDGSEGVTFSYDIASGKFVSEHSYVPDFYFWDRNKMFSVKDGNIYKHNMEGGYTTYYGEAAPCTISFITHAPDTEVIRYVNSSMDTEVNVMNSANVPDVFNTEDTVDHVTVWNDFQTSGRMVVEIEEQNKVDTSDTAKLEVSRRELLKWKFNNIQSREISRDANIMTLGVCGKDQTLNETNVTQDNDIQTEKVFEGHWLGYKLEFNQNDKQIIFFGMNTHVQESDEK